MTGYTTKRERERIERREEHRRLLRGVDIDTMAYLLGTAASRNDVAEADRGVVEDRFRAGVDNLLENEDLREHLTVSAENMALDLAQQQLIGGGLPRPAYEIARAALGRRRNDSGEIWPGEESGARLIAFAALAIAADEVADDGYRDPRLES